MQFVHLLDHISINVQVRTSCIETYHDGQKTSERLEGLCEHLDSILFIQSVVKSSLTHKSVICLGRGSAIDTFKTLLPSSARAGRLGG